MASMVTCGSCGRASPAEFSFCPYCAAPLGTRPAARTERKVVTVLFCDLVGFTSRSDRADPEDVRALLQPFHALARSEIEGHGGTLDKFIGDAAMGVFGSPVAHEDDPERAIRAALRILDGIRGLGDRLPGKPLDVRVGVNTGEAVVTFASGALEGENVAGDVVNTAARLQTAAQPGTVLVGRATFEAAHGAVDFEELEPVAAKGKAEPVRVWRVMAARPVGARSDRTSTSPFVGREAERAILEHSFRRAMVRGSLELVTLVGDPGVGKSRLVAEFRGSLPLLSLEIPVQWYRGRCLPYGEGVTFWALGEIVKELSGILESDRHEEREEKLDVVVGAHATDSAQRAWLRARLAPLAGLEADAMVERDESFAAWRTLLESLARRRPLVLVFEDVHWADSAMVAFLEHMVDFAGPSPMLLLATARPELHDRHPSWRERMGTSAALSLSPLTEDETSRLVSGLVQGARLLPQTASRILERSGGNPLYAEEFVRVLRDRGLLGDEGGPGAELGSIEFPHTVQALIAARLDTLPAESKSLVQDASVIGRVFWSGAAASLAGRPEPEVRDHLEQLVRRELLRTVATSSMAGEREYIFWHALVRDVAYAQIPRAARAERHRGAIAWIESKAGERLADVAEILAHHALSSLELMRAAGGGDQPAERASAARYLRLAADRALALDLTKAEAHLRGALELTAGDDPEHPRTLSRLAEVVFQAGRLDEADELYREAVDRLRRQDDVRAAADAMARRSVVLEYRGEAVAGRALLAEAVRMLERLPPGAELARSLATNAGSLMVAGRYGDALVQAERAIALAEEVGERPAAARARGFHGYARALGGDPAGVEDQRQSIKALLELGMGRAAAVAQNNLGTCLSVLEGPAAANEVLREGIALAESRGLREMAVAMRNSMLDTLRDLGEWDEVLRLVEEVVQEARRLGLGYDEVAAEPSRAFILAWRQGADALELCDSVLERVRPLEDAPILLSAILAAGVASSEAGDRARVASLVREALAATRDESVTHRALELPQLVRLAIGAGDLDLAADLFTGVDRPEVARYVLALGAAEASLLEAREDLEPALAAYERCAAGWASLAMVLEEAESHFGAGRCLAELNRPSSGVDRHLSVALGIFERLDARPARDRVAAFASRHQPG